MFIVQYNHIRRDNKTPFYADTPEGAAQLDAIVAKVNSANGFTSRIVGMSSDKLVNFVQVAWDNILDYNLFEAANAAELGVYRASRQAYERANGGATRSGFLDQTPMLAI